MDKNAIKKYAVWARRELIERVEKKAQQYGIEENSQADANADSVNGKLLTSEEKKERQALIAQISDKGYEQVMEEVAYTWFNRFSALRFMEVNGYLPTHVRVFTDEENKFKPQILAEAIRLELDGLDMEKVYDLKEANKTDELYKYLLFTQCNALNAILPGMFQKIADCTELLLPDNLLREGSVIEQMITLIPEDDWTDQVQIIGWLYQYYNDERKNEVINIYKGTVKKDDIPAATQLFTTDWVVRYMVDNSLGRYWIERNPNSILAEKLGFFVTPKNGKIKYIDEKITPAELSFFDPCMGSGHILVYAFDVLMDIYRECGYTDRDAVQSIIENNIYGLDIDDRASQLAYFAVMMKARSYDRRFLTRGISPNVTAIQESNGLPRISSVEGQVKIDDIVKINTNQLLDSFEDAKELGSLVCAKDIDFESIKQFMSEFEKKGTDNLFDLNWYQSVFSKMNYFIRQGEILSKTYTVVCTNPPYMNKLEGNLKKFVIDKYKDYSGDLFSVFLYRNFDFCKQNGYSAFMTPFVWMFIKTYEKLREYIIKNKSITSLIQMEYSAFEEATVPICSFVLKNGKETDKGLYFKLSDFKGGMDIQKQKVLEALANKECGYFYEAAKENFSKIPSSPIAYWVSDSVLACYKNKNIYDYANPCKGIDTGDNNTFLRLWFEVPLSEQYIPKGVKCSEIDFKEKRWFPYNKGGGFRKWYGNNEYVLDWSNNGVTLKNFRGSNLRNKERYFTKGITWSTITSGNSSFRYFEYGFLFDNGGSCLFADNHLSFIQGLLNSIVCHEMLSIQPTINNQPGTIGSIPIIIDNENVVDNLVTANVEFSKIDWDSFETSWDFEKHPLLIGNSVQSAFENWDRQCNNRFNTLKANEEELNRIYIDIYGLQDELAPEEDDKDVTVRKADLQRDIKSLISYTVGCMFGRYSLDEDGLAYAGGEWDSSKYKTYPADKDNIIPICDDEYFEDDIVGRFVKFIEIVYGKDTLEENLKFIADALGGKGSPREVIRNYFLIDFFNDHCKTYQKRPIYWQFDSGKKNGFKCLIYMHRYQPDTIMRIRTDYVHEQQSRYRTAITDLETHIADASTSERVKLNKQLSKLQGQADEVHAYEEKIHHLADQMINIDLDDGVKHNYAIFQDVLAKIK